MSIQLRSEETSGDEGSSPPSIPPALDSLRILRAPYGEVQIRHAPPAPSAHAARADATPDGHEETPRAPTGSRWTTRDLVLAAAVALVTAAAWWWMR